MIAVDAMFPVMVTRNLAAVKLFYETVFGFTAVFYDSNFYLHLISPNNNIQLGFLLPNLASQPEFLHPIMSSKGFILSLEVKDAALAYTEAKQMDLNLIMTLKQEEWGQIHFMIQDPAGFSVDVVQHLQTTDN
ncbi:MAG: putative glyoxalase superfamily protein PhnB [Alteromonadaceae bacterium]|jgi:uncharacterized glyoxalase superfamily protein PhnB